MFVYSKHMSSLFQRFGLAIQIVFRIFWLRMQFATMFKWLLPSHSFILPLSSVFAWFFYLVTNVWISSISCDAQKVEAKLWEKLLIGLVDIKTRCTDATCFYQCCTC
jgi:hypothetical protein